MSKNKLYADLEEYIDLNEFDNLHYKICKGFAKARHLASVGNFESSIDNIVKNTSYDHLCQVYQNYQLCAENTEIKKISNDLKDSELAVFLKFALGGNDSYHTYFVDPLREFFPEVDTWIKNLKLQNIFSTIEESTFLTLDSGGIPFEHFHPDKGTPAEFIHIRPKIVRPFYIRNDITSEKVYINARAAWWDDRLPHGGDPVLTPTYTLRIDGVFTDEFRQKISNG
jgi:hypothetical protein